MGLLCDPGKVEEMTDEKRVKVEEDEGAVPSEGARRATGEGTARSATQGALVDGQRWSRARKRDVVLRMLRGESLDALSRELAVEIYRLEEWREQAMAGLDAGLRGNKTDPSELRLAEAHKRLGEALMENELLRERCRRQGIPLPPGMSKR